MGLSIATLLAPHNHVVAVDIIPEKVELINNRKLPQLLQRKRINTDYILRKEKREPNYFTQLYGY